nr:type II toxin-antitoxin system HicA family toxin [Pseudorhizobium pelagicum]
MRSGDVIAVLKNAGWLVVATKGSHVQFKHPALAGRVTVPHPKRDIRIGTLKSIEKAIRTKAEVTQCATISD